MDFIGIKYPHQDGVGRHKKSHNMLPKSAGRLEMTKTK